LRERVAVLPIGTVTSADGLARALKRARERAGSKTRGRTIAGLTGLRGVAAAWVVLFHLTQDLHISVLENGALGVDVFFILSGFVLSYVYAPAFDPTGFRDYVRFLRARIVRIYPLHFVMLCFVGCVVITLPDFASRYPTPDSRFGIDAFFASLLLIQSWFHWLPGNWNAPSWSLSAEWFAYLTFPAFLVATQRWRSAATALFLAAGSLVAFFVSLELKGVSNPVVFVGTTGLVRMVCEFACGCLLFRAMAIGIRPVPAYMNIIALVLLFLAMVFAKAIFLAVPAFAVIVLTTAQDRGWIARCLSTKPIVFLGEISYSIYLVHWIVLQISNWMLRDIHQNVVQFWLWNTGLPLRNSRDVDDDL
jgi:peptidoglycan/LPS O-acetylase OafA/YrhL